MPSPLAGLKLECIVLVRTAQDSGDTRHKHRIPLAGLKLLVESLYDRDEIGHKHRIPLAGLKLMLVVAVIRLIALVTNTESRLRD